MSIFCFFTIFFALNCLSNGERETDLSMKRCDDFYSAILGLPNPDPENKYNNGIPNSDQIRQIDAAILYTNTVEMLSYAHYKKDKNPLQQVLFYQKWNEWEQIREILNNAPRGDKKDSMIKMCKLWRFWRTLGDLFAEHEMMRSVSKYFVQKQRQKISNLEQIDCEEMAKIVGEFDETQNEIPKYIKAYFEDLKRGHFQVLVIVMQHSGDVVEKEVELQFSSFTEYFGHAQLKDEKNVAYQLRLLSQNSEKNAEKILEVKLTLEKLIGADFMFEFEFRHPMRLAINIISDKMLATEYLVQFSNFVDVSLEFETRLAIRMYFGRIWAIFVKINLLQKKHPKNQKILKILTQIQAFWDGGNLQKLLKQIVKLELIIKFYDFWLGMAKLYNKLPGLESTERIKIQVPKRATNLEAARIELLEEQSQNMAKLYRGENGVQIFKRIFENSLSDGKGTKYRMVAHFWRPKNLDREQNELCQNWYINLLELTNVYPALSELLKIELTDEAIAKIQMDNYLKFFDAKNSQNIATKAQFILNALAIYQWFKTELPFLGGKQREKWVQGLAYMEVCMDTIWLAENYGQITAQESAFLEAAMGMKSVVMPDDSTKFIAGLYHRSILWELLHHGNFEEQLKKTLISKERLANIGLNDLAIFDGVEMSESKNDENNFKKITINISTQEQTKQIRQKAWEIEDDKMEMYHLMMLYRQLLMNDDIQFLSPLMRETLNIEALYLHNKEWLRKCLAFLHAQIGKNKKNPQFSRTAIMIGIEASKAEQLLFGKSESYVEKQSKLCCTLSFSQYLFGNPILYENAEWANFLNDNGLRRKGVDYQITDSPQWNKPENCELIIEEVLSHMDDPFIRLTTHQSTMGVLFHKFPQFAHFICENAAKFPRTREYAKPLTESEQLFYYKNGLESANLTNDHVVTMKMLTNLANSKESSARTCVDKLETMDVIYPENATKNKNMTVKYIAEFLLKAHEEENMNSQENNSKFDRVKAEIYAIVNGINIFGVKDAENLRIQCIMAHYAEFLDKTSRLQAEEWAMPFHCLTMDIDEIREKVRNVLATENLKFLLEHLQNCDSADEILQILRNSPGAMKLTEQLFLGDGMAELWSSVRQRLINWNFFDDKMRLLGHYQAALATVSVSDRILADIMVFTNFIQRYSHHSSVFRRHLNILWFHFRYPYDKCHLTKNWHDFVEISQTLSVVIPEVNNFLRTTLDNKSFSEDKIKREYERMSTNALRKAQKMILIAGDKVAKPIGVVQQLHFDVLQNFENRTSDKNLLAKYEKLITDLSANVGHRKNLLKFLTVEDLYKFFTKIGVKFDENELGIEPYCSISTEHTNKPENNQKSKNKKKKSIKKDKIKGSPEKSELLEYIEIENEMVEKISENGDQLELSENNLSELKNGKIHNEIEEMNNFEKQNKIQIIWPEQLEEKSDAQFEKSLLQELISIKSFNDFCNESKFNDRYKDFICSPSEAKHFILNIGAYINEICSIFKIEKLSENSQINLYPKEFDEIRSELIQKIEILDNENIRDEMLIVEKKFYNLLRKFSYAKNLTNIREMEKIGDEELFNMKSQFHLKNLSFLILNDENFESEWNEYEDKLKKEKLMYLLGRRFGITRLEKVKSDLKIVMDQIHIDQEFYNKNISESDKHKYIRPDLAKYSQQIIFMDPPNEEKTLELILNTAEYSNSSEFHNKLKNVIETINSMVKKWNQNIENAIEKLYRKSKKDILIKMYINNQKTNRKLSKNQARLVVSGSFLLGSHTINSDIDLLCIVPGKVIKRSDFFGNDILLCEDVNNKCEQNESLYCRLCQNPMVTNLIKIPFGPVFVIKFKFDDIEFDLSFVAIPRRNSLLAKLNDATIEKYLEKFDFSSSNFGQKKMLRSISSYRTNLYMANLLFNGQINNNLEDFLQRNIENCKTNKKAEQFFAIVLVIKSWAKNHFIYSNRYGYLNGVNIAIMAIKIILLYPNATVPFLIEKFFFFYSLRPLSVPIAIEPLNPSAKIDLFFVKNPTEQEMPVYTPMYPEQNAGSLITHSTARTIRREMVEALNKMKADKNTFNWSMILKNDIRFIDKFDHFILINCMSVQIDGGEEFCNFVGSRIRLQLVYNIDIKDGGIGLETQLYPDIYWKNCEICQNFINNEIQTQFCHIWLVGLKFTNNQDENINNELEKFDMIIKRDYLKYNPSEEENENEENQQSPKQTLFLELNYEYISSEFRKLNFELRSIVARREELDDVMKSAVDQ